MRGFLLSLFLIFYGTHIPGIICQSDGFEAFLSNAANEFFSWIAENGLDPTPGSPRELIREYSEGFVNITRLRIWNEIGTGYSSLHYPNVRANLLQGEFAVELRGFRPDFNVTAEYEVEGTVLSSMPVTGEGKIITERVSRSDYIYLHVNGFEITPDGYINMSAGNVYSGLDLTYNYNASFEDLSAGGFEEEVSRILRDMYAGWSMNQVGDYLRSYFEALFAETPLSEIIGAPCLASAIQEDGFTFVEGNVIDKNVTVNEKGEMEEFVTKLVVFKRKL